MTTGPVLPGDVFLAKALSYWREKGGRMTIVRDIISKTVGGSGSAFVADELWLQVRKIDPTISMASIYRTLADLVDAGLVREIHGQRDQRSFVKEEADESATGHVICKDCHRIIPLNNDCLALREGAKLRSLGFATHGMHLQIEAACESLKQSGVCDHTVEERRAGRGV